MKAAALWIASKGLSQIRSVDVSPQAGEALVQTVYSGISRGTERLVYGGLVPEAEHQTMRAPFQEGEFTFPLKYGYAAVGKLLNTERAGQYVFALYPHQTQFAVPPEAALSIPPSVPANRAILAANMETALTILWDSGIAPGDRVSVVGCGVIGALVGYLAARIPGTSVTLIDIDPSREALGKDLGCGFSQPMTAPGNADVVVHCSATSAGLETAIALAGVEAAIIEASWYGTKHAELSLGGKFHHRRLRIVGSQVGRIPPTHAARWTFARRLAMAISLLDDPVLDTLISSESRFEDLGEAYGQILFDPATLCHRICYGA